MFSFFKEKKMNINQIKEWKKEESAFFAAGVLVHVKNGKGMLREVYGEDNGKCFMSLLMGNKPLIQFQANEDYYCPTCEKIIRAGYGLDSKEWAEQVKKQRKELVQTNSLSQEIEQLYPLLNLLKEGYYVVVDTELYPTDGNGHLFWEALSDKPALGSCIYYYGDCEWGNLRPYFTIASQPIEKCDKERIDYYLKHPKEKAVAYYLDGYMTVLLDGHHKTFAAALRHEKVKALVIIPMTCIYNPNNKGSREFGFADIRFEESQLNINEYGWEKIEYSTERIDEEVSKEIAQKFKQSRGNVKFPVEIEGLAQYYPTAEEVAAIDRAGEISQEMLKEILSRQKVCTCEEACIILKALVAMHHHMAQKIGAFFSKQAYDSSTLYEIIKELTRLPRTQQLEDFLIERMVELEEDHPEIKKLILGYL